MFPARLMAQPGTSQYQSGLRTKPSLRIYLTFDDGIIPESILLDTLARTDSLPLSLFLIGRNVLVSDESKAIFAEMKQNRNISFGNHSYSHASGRYKKYYSNKDIVVADVLKNEDSLQFHNHVARLPGRNVWEIAGRSRYDLPDAKPAGDSLVRLGYQLIGWDCEWRYDSSAKSYLTATAMARLVANCKHTFRPGAVVILCHDKMLGDSAFFRQLRLFVTIMRAAGHSFASIEHYPGIAAAAIITSRKKTTDIFLSLQY